jgi:hypothetical protein
MAIANDLNLDEISSEADNDKFTIHNEDNRRLAASVAGRISVDMGADANLTLNASDDDGTESWRYKFITITDTGVLLTAGRDVIFPAKGPSYVIKNSTAQTLTIKITGQTGVAIATTASASLYYNGTDMAAVP